MARAILFSFFLLGSMNSLALSLNSVGSSASSGGAIGNFGVSSTLYIDVYGYFGSVTGKLEGQSESLSLNQQGIGFTIAPLFGGFFLGLGTDYRQINNSKDPSAQVGSFKGTRWAPLVVTSGFIGESFLLKLEYQPFGIFNLSQRTLLGDSISYGDGHGYRVSALYNLFANFMIGPSFEVLNFPSRFDSGQGQVGGQSLTLTQISLAGAYVF